MLTFKKIIKKLGLKKIFIINFIFFIYGITLTFSNNKVITIIITLFVILLFIHLTKTLIKQKSYKIITLKEIDKMTGEDFERFLVKLYNKKGQKAKMTKGSHDQGGDLIIRRIVGKDKVVQAKRYSNKVGNKAIQEVVASLAYYSAKKAEVYTNNFYTKSAKELAKANNVKLFNRDSLKRDLKKYKIKKEED